MADEQPLNLVQLVADYFLLELLVKYQCVFSTLSKYSTITTVIQKW
ncbi:hypothetical protein Nizo2766_1927 [Lactiplantibacillus plantarum]|nr:hypothetical protein AWV72_02800 [Lactiplantibacillus plantarum]KZT89610.1 hypothetical protein Nizo2256_1393 [Lactiplantibacillus plantarum]KZU44354.1 hypothetical protein Nizo2766_1927 [Lactiplantibacillus plantarum]KZU46297.1 hypothetical protein Nizo2757_0904 [Lactiplantibacillus plantarum]KZU56564.1 hypothetical protein Nizo2801_0367 [Lactiplantibacillus plantarum]